MEKQIVKEFNVCIYDCNRKKFVTYDIIPYLVNAYKERIENHKEYPDNDYFKIPSTFEELKKFVNDESMYQFWSRCEYEIILVDWPCQQISKKIVLKKIKFGTEIDIS